MKWSCLCTSEYGLVGRILIAHKQISEAFRRGICRCEVRSGVGLKDNCCGLQMSVAKATQFEAWRFTNRKQFWLPPRRDKPSNRAATLYSIYMVLRVDKIVMTGTKNIRCTMHVSKCLAQWNSMLTFIINSSLLLERQWPTRLGFVQRVYQPFMIVLWDCEKHRTISWHTGSVSRFGGKPIAASRYVQGNGQCGAQIEGCEMGDLTKTSMVEPTGKALHWTSVLPGTRTSLIGSPFAILFRSSHVNVSQIFTSAYIIAVWVVTLRFAMSATWTLA